MHRSAHAAPPLIAHYMPKTRRSSVATGAHKQEMDTLELNTMALPEEAMGRFWGMFIGNYPGNLR